MKKQENNIFNSSLVQDAEKLAKDYTISELRINIRNHNEGFESNIKNNNELKCFVLAYTMSAIDNPGILNCLTEQV